MNEEYTYLVGVHRYAYKAGEKGLVIGVRFVQPDDMTECRLSYKVLYDDGSIDYVPQLSINHGHYEFVSESSVKLGLIPCIKF